MRCVTTLGVASKRVELEQVLVKEEEEVMVVGTSLAVMFSLHRIYQVYSAREDVLVHGSSPPTSGHRQMEGNHGTSWKEM